MYEKVVITQTSETTKKKAYKLIGDKLGLNLVIYTDLGSNTKNLTVVREPVPLNAFSEFMLDMDNYDSITPTNDLVAINDYLGILGISVEFPIVRVLSDRQKKVNAKYKSPYKKG